MGWTRIWDVRMDRLMDGPTDDYMFPPKFFGEPKYKSLNKLKILKKVK